MKDQKVADRLAFLEGSKSRKGVLSLHKDKGDVAHFPEFILAFWGELEYYIDTMFASAYGLDYDDVKTSFLTNQDFEDKANFLVKIGVLEKDQRKTIRTFQDERNELFHNKRGREQLYFTLTEPEKKERMEHAWEAFMAASFALSIAFPDEPPSEDPPDEAIQALNEPPEELED